ncbi:MAG: DsbA family oxidoreductase [Hyphomicrobiales bacterium]|nr:DsbA family oxidoreductase [Hyphomicrobiales bacterium]
MSSPAPILEVDIISDVMCPWCYIGKRRLERALTERTDIAVDVRWRPFQLDASIPPEGMDRKEYLDRKFGPDRADEVYASIKQAGASEGIPFAFEKIERSPNTIDAHRVVRWAASAGNQQVAVERLFAGYFIEGRDLNDSDYLAEVGEVSGLDRALVDRLLAGDADRDEVAKEVHLAQRMGVHGVPCFIFAAKYVVMGAQDPSVLVQAIDRAYGGLKAQARTGEHAS